MKALSNALFIVILLFSCKENNSEVQLQECDSYFTSSKDDNNNPVGIWKYYDSQKNLIYEENFQYSNIDTLSISSIRKYFAGNGRLIRVEAVKKNNSIVELYDGVGQMVSNRDLGEILADEYCFSCHKMNDNHIGPKLGDGNYTDSQLILMLRSDQHKLSSSNLIWENSEDFNFLQLDHIKAIREFLNSSD